MNPFREVLEKSVRRIGWREFVRRAEGEFTGGALQGWMRGAFPGPAHQVVIAKIINLPIEMMRDLVWRSEMAREEARIIVPFAAAAPVARTVGPPRKPLQPVVATSVPRPKGRHAVVA